MTLLWASNEMRTSNVTRSPESLAGVIRICELGLSLMNIYIKEDISSLLGGGILTLVAAPIAAQGFLSNWPLQRPHRLTSAGWICRLFRCRAAKGGRRSSYGCES